MFHSADRNLERVEDADRPNGQMTVRDAALLLFACVASLCAILFALAT